MKRAAAFPDRRCLEANLRRLVLPIFLITALLMNCAYYNTFFNAKKQFGKAEEAYREHFRE